MNQFEQSNNTLEQQIENITLKACAISETQKVVEDSKDKIEAIRAVRELLLQHIPEISQLPEPESLKEETGGRFKNPLGGRISNDFRIAKYVVELLYNKKQ